MQNEHCLVLCIVGETTDPLNLGVRQEEGELPLLVYLNHCVRREAKLPLLPRIYLTTGGREEHYLFL